MHMANKHTKMLNIISHQEMQINIKSVHIC